MVGHAYGLRISWTKLSWKVSKNVLILRLRCSHWWFEFTSSFYAQIHWLLPKNALQFIHRRDLSTTYSNTTVFTIWLLQPVQLLLAMGEYMGVTAWHAWWHTQWWFVSQIWCLYYCHITMQFTVFWVPPSGFNVFTRENHGIIISVHRLWSSAYQKKTQCSTTLHSVSFLLQCSREITCFASRAAGRERDPAFISAKAIFR